MSTSNNKRVLAIAGMIVLAAIIRIINSMNLLPGLSYFSPLGAMALFGGAYFSKGKAFLIPLLTMFLSDLVINLLVLDGKYGWMYSGWYMVYGIFLLLVGLGRLLLKKPTIVHFLGTSLLAALLHWFIADGLVWLNGGTDLRTMTPLSRDWAGLAQCYVQGFPFMKNFLAGNLLYGSILFGSFEWMQRRLPQLQLQTN